MCSGGVNPKSGRPKNNRHIAAIGDALFKQQVAKETKKYGIARTDIFESNEDYYKRVQKFNEKKVAEQERQNRALIAQQQAQSQVLQRQMLDQQNAQNKKVGELRDLQFEKLKGIRSKNDAAVSSLRILGQQQPTAPTAAQSVPRSRKQRPGSTSTSVSRGSAQGRGANLSI